MLSIYHGKKKMDEKNPGKKSHYFKPDRTVRDNDFNPVRVEFQKTLTQILTVLYIQLHA